MFLLRIFLAISLITLLMFISVTLYNGNCTRKAHSRQYDFLRVEEGNVADCLQSVKETQPTTNSSAVTDTGANTTMFVVGLNQDPLGTKSTLLPVLDKHNFTSLPQWKFDDTYRLDPQFKQSKCMASLRNSSNPVFKEKFIPNIQLFLQSDHLNMSEWNRLYHFNNPFGYMGLNYSATKAAVDTIPKLTSTQLLQVPIRAKDGCIRCAVVGTGGILNGSRLGKEIDSSDYVFRVNAAIIAGHEEDVGKRTSVYVHTAHSLIQSLMVHKKRGFKQIPTDKDIKYVLIPEGPRDYNFLESLMKNRKIPSGAYRGRTPRNRKVAELTTQSCSYQTRSSTLFFWSVHTLAAPKAAQKCHRVAFLHRVFILFLI
ncbi:alpha-N-acetylgalactosaminide alpha-2,6-sialyltransferase 1-like isoform X3 [Sinocyclocheilus anshuiensis]|uniref:alpha-N-acetylgalactosaminide alpha-2,6-sialyltransferase 1-like isoform X3 n=1 Tax=Sinocyclocheilus anshuiensis TaxID=1608454 RepID=UPI0007BA0D10|nr:PREDICTED: alpha-N-acetylgalactosaminide alpha-2,6-sialyltransferase 1-like isoform X3 [Sinocyclocheilus anshuiensis]